MRANRPMNSRFFTGLLAALLALASGCTTTKSEDPPVLEPADQPELLHVDDGNPPPIQGNSAPLISPGSTVTLGRALTGQVLGPGKAAFVPRAEVTVSDSSGKIVASVVADEEGRFATRDLPPSLYRVQISDPGRRYFTNQLDRVDPTRGGLQIEMQRGHHIAGAVVEAGSRRSAAGIRISLRKLPGSDELASAVSGRDGGFEFGPLESAQYELTADVPGAKSEKLHLLDDIIGLELSVPDVYMITGLVLRSAGPRAKAMPMVGAKVTLLDAEKKQVATADSIENGMFVMTAPPPGSYLLLVEEKGGAGRGEELVVVPDGAAPRPVRLLVEGPGTIRGKVKLEDQTLDPAQVRIWLMGARTDQVPLQVTYPVNGEYSFPSGVTSGKYVVRAIAFGPRGDIMLERDVTLGRDESVAVDFVFDQ